MSARDYVFTLTDGTTTVTLTTAPWAIRSYVPTHPQIALEKSAAVGYAGEAVNGARFNNLVETFGLRYIGTAANAVTAVETVLAMLRLAEYRANDAYGSQVYLTAKNATGAAVYQSRVYSGRVDWGDNTLDTYWKNDVFSLDLIVERTPYWEAQAYTTAIDTEAILPIYGSPDNFLGPYTGLGDLPAPVRVDFRDTAAAGSTGKIWACVGFPAFVGSPAYRPSETYGYDQYTAGATVTMTTISDASSTSGSAANCAWTDTTQIELFRISAPTGDPSFKKFHGKPCAVVLKLSAVTGYSDLYLRARVLDVGAGLTIAEAPWVLASGTILWNEIGLVPLPPFKGLVDSVANLAIVVDAKRANSSNVVKLAQVNIIPVDGVKRYTPIGTAGIADDEYLIDDPDVGVYVTDTTGTANARRLYQAQGELFIQPGQANYWTFWFAKSDGLGSWNRTATAKISYKIRRATL